MKIALVVGYFDIVSPYSEFYVMRELEKLGHEVCTITSNRLNPRNSLLRTSDRRSVKVGKHLEDQLLVYRLRMAPGIGGIDLFCFGLGQALADFSPDIVKVGVLSPLMIPVLRHKHKFGLDYRVFADSVSGIFGPTPPKALAFDIYRWFLKDYLRRNIDGYFAIAEGSRLWLQKNFSVPKELIDVVPLGADCDLYAPDVSSRSAIRDILKIEDDSQVLLYSGKIEPGKDIDVLVKAASLVSARCRKRVCLLIMGNGAPAYLTYVKNVVKSSGMERNTRFVQTLDRLELPKYYNAADIAVWPGNLSISIISAMAVGLPIVVPDYAETRADAFDSRHLLEYGNGLSFRRGDVANLASSIERLVTQNGLVEKMGKESRRLALDKLNWRAITRQYLEAYARG